MLEAHKHGHTYLVDSDTHMWKCKEWTVGGHTPDSQHGGFSRKWMHHGREWRKGRNDRESLHQPAFWKEKENKTLKENLTNWDRCLFWMLEVQILIVLFFVPVCALCIVFQIREWLKEGGHGTKAERGEGVKEGEGIREGEGSKIGWAGNRRVR